MKTRPGLIIEQRIKGEAKELPDIGYPIPDARQNQYELERLFTESYDAEDRALKKENDENQ
jgi:hypothetical protein